MAYRPLPSLFLAILLVADPERFQLPVQRRALHADERGGARDVARETPDLDLEIFALEGFAGFAERAAHDRHGRRRQAGGALIVHDFARQEVDLDARNAVAGGKDDG